MTFVFLGPQGAGKGTQARLIAEEFGFEHVSIGDYLRKEVAKQSDVGKLIQSYMLEGKLIPTDVNNQIIRGIIEGRDDLIIDGYPRTSDQARFLFSNFKIQGLVVLDIGEEESLRRLSKRLVCTANHKNFIEGHVSEKDVLECEALGGKIIRRSDDEPRAIKKRLEIYHKETEPLIELFVQNNIPVVRVNAERSVDEIFSEVKEKIKHLF